LTWSESVESGRQIGLIAAAFLKSFNLIVTDPFSKLYQQHERTVKVDHHWQFNEGNISEKSVGIPLRMDQPLIGCETDSIRLIDCNILSTQIHIG